MPIVPAIDDAPIGSAAADLIAAAVAGSPQVCGALAQIDQAARAPPAAGSRWAATAGREDSHAVVRLSTILRSGQTQTISVPGPDGSLPHALRLRRLVDGIEVLAAGPETLTD